MSTHPRYIVMETDDSLFLDAFESCTLPRSEWTHRAHLRMAYLYLRDTPDPQLLLAAVRQRIRNFNEANRNRTGYHETITAAFLRIVADRMRRKACPTFSEFEAFHPDLFAPGGAVLLRYYARETLFSPEARATFVPPDREPLP